MKKICIIGSLNMDMVINTPRLPTIGETIIGNNFMTSAGGKGANQAYTVQKLGGNAVMLGCVGDDIHGQQLIDNLFNIGVDTSAITKIKNCATGVAIIVLHKGDNCIIVDTGANNKFSINQLKDFTSYIDSCAMVMLQLEIPFDTVKHAIMQAKTAGKKVLLDPAPYRHLDDKILSMVDILIPNEKECASIVGFAIDSIADAKRAVEVLRNKGINQVIITLGRNGVAYNADSDFFHKPALCVKAIDTTGAGDVFAGALATAITDNKDIHTAIDFAITASALAVTKKGATQAVPSLTEVQSY